MISCILFSLSSYSSIGRSRKLHNSNRWDDYVKKINSLNNFSLQNIFKSQLIPTCQKPQSYSKNRKGSNGWCSNNYWQSIDSETSTKVNFVYLCNLELFFFFNLHASPLILNTVGSLCFLMYGYFQNLN